MSYPVDWQFIEEFLDACFQDAREQGRELYQEFLDTPSESFLFRITMFQHFLTHAHLGMPPHYIFANHADGIPTRYRCVTLQKDMVAAVAYLCSELGMSGIVKTLNGKVEPSTRLLYCLQQKYAYFGRGESDYTDLFCAWAEPEQDRIVDVFVRRRKLQALLTSIVTP